MCPLQMMADISDVSNEFCERIIEISLHKDILKNLKWKSLSETTLNDRSSSGYPRREFVAEQERILNNVVRRAETKARKAFRKCHAVDIVQKFRHVKEDPVIFCLFCLFMQDDVAVLVHVAKT